MIVPCLCRCIHFDRHTCTRAFEVLGRAHTHTHTHTHHEYVPYYTCTSLIGKAQDVKLVRTGPRQLSLFADRFIVDGVDLKKQLADALARIKKLESDAKSSKNFFEVRVRVCARARVCVCVCLCVCVCRNAIRVESTRY